MESSDSDSVPVPVPVSVPVSVPVTVSVSETGTETDTVTDTGTDKETETGTESETITGTESESELKSTRTRRPSQKSLVSFTQCDSPPTCRTKTTKTPSGRDCEQFERLPGRIGVRGVHSGGVPVPTNRP